MLSFSNSPFCSILGPIGLVSLMSLTLFSACSPSYQGIEPVMGPKDTPESVLGERLFREPRFAKFFVREAKGNPNAVLPHGDPALARLPSNRRGDLSSPFARQSMSCVACHMVDDAQFTRRGGIRGYADFAVRTPIPAANSDLTGNAHAQPETTPRNSPILLGAFIARAVPFLLHYDGEFTTIEDLVIGSYTGRNFGWLPGEKAEALANIVRVIREDNGSDPLASRFSNRVSYREMLLGQSPSIARTSLLAPDSRMDVARESDEAILARVSSLVKTYLEALQFATDPVTGVYNGSPYDEFLLTNLLPQKPDDGESDADYARRLAWALQGLGNPQWVSNDVGEFGPKELEGAKIFLARSKAPGATGPGSFQVGNCVACHAPPNFTDFKMHNTGATQDEYDSLHGRGSFMALHVPSLSERKATPDAFLPATEAHPQASSRFRAVPSVATPGLTDLGAWNIFANADFPAPQSALETFFCIERNGCMNEGVDPATQEAALSRALASFKTPGLRGLALSDPYLHTGQKATLGEVLRFYQEMARLAREGQLRNADPELALVDVDRTGVEALEAFLNALNEDYE